MFDGRSPVNGYYLDVKEASAGEECWKGVHEKVNKMKYMKVRKMHIIQFEQNWFINILMSDTTCEILVLIVGGWTLSYPCLLCAKSGDWTEGWRILCVPRACSKSCWSWKALCSLRSNPGPDSPW